MRNLSPGFRARLDSGATTLCACWRITRQDGVVQGFTDHDVDIIFDGVTYSVMSGLDGSGFDAELGFSVGGAEVSGALSSASIEESDLLNGVWDGARVELWRVDWREPAHRMLQHVAIVGEVRRSGGSFVAELRSLSHGLDQERGRLYGANCDADLGDARCSFLLAASPFRVDLPVDSGTRAQVKATLPVTPSGFYTGGRIKFLSGSNEGAHAHIKDHTDNLLTLWTPLAQAPTPGDQFRLTAGCDKTFATCQAKFGNVINFRGFPHLPGNDAVFSYPARVLTQQNAALEVVRRRAEQEAAALEIERDGLQEKFDDLEKALVSTSGSSDGARARFDVGVVRALDAIGRAGADARSP